MSAQARNKRKVKDRAERLIRRAFARGAPQSFLAELMLSGELALIGGAIRDAYLQGTQNFQSDFDFVLHPRSISDFTALVLAYGAVENRFGGYRLDIDRWKIDVWPLQYTWAHTAGHHRVNNFQDLLGVTFFDWDAVVYNLSTRKVIVEEKYFERVSSGILDVNLLPNPNPLGNAVRALRYACRWNVAFGPTLVRHIHEMYLEHGAARFLEAERKSFHSVLLNPVLLDCVFDEVGRATSFRKAESVYPLRSYERQRTLLPALETSEIGGTLSAVSSRPPYDARAVANLLLDLAGTKNLQLTQVSLLKLIYFAHGWYLAKFGTRLIQQDFEAWQHGPVVKVIRDEFKTFGKNPITTRARKLDIYSGQRTLVIPNLSIDDANFVRSIFDAYHGYGAWKLSDMTHEEGSPWDRLWNSAEPVGRMALRIKDEEIKSHFDSLSKRLPLS